MTAEQIDSTVRSWLRATAAEPPEPGQAAREIRARATTIGQRSRWWPLPSGRRTRTIASHMPDSGSPPTTASANGGQTGMVTGTIRRSFGLTVLVAVAAIVVLLGSGLLIARSWEQPAKTIPGAGASVIGAFSPAGELTEARFGHTATLLPDGRVLVVGGTEADAETVIAPAEVWDPATATFGSAGSLAQARTYAPATLLPDGRVLIVGGMDWADQVFASAEVWDPTTESFSPAGSLAAERVFPAATLLRDGRVLVVGGNDSDGSLTSAEIWDPATQTFSPAGSLAEPRAVITATTLSDGRVLVVGTSTVYDPDCDDDYYCGPALFTASAEVWDPTTESFSPAGSLAEIREGHDGLHALLLEDDHVLVLGQTAEGIVAAEIWDPATETFSPADSLAEARTQSAQSATLLPDGRVLLVDFAQAKLWDPATGSFGLAGRHLDYRDRMIHSATLLSDGRVLIVGGGSGSGLPAMAELWAPDDR